MYLFIIGAIIAIAGITMLLVMVYLQFGRVRKGPKYVKISGCTTEQWGEQVNICKDVLLENGSSGDIIYSFEDPQRLIGTHTTIGEVRRFPPSNWIMFAFVTAMGFVLITIGGIRKYQNKKLT